MDYVCETCHKHFTDYRGDRNHMCGGELKDSVRTR